MRSLSPAANCFEGRLLRWNGHLGAGLCMAMLCFLPGTCACVERADQHSVWLGQTTKQGCGAGVAATAADD